MLDKNSTKPIYSQISDSLKRKIEKGEFEIGKTIPSEGSLAEKYKVSRMTIRQAINTLVEEGYLYKKRGIGTFVADFKLRHDAYKLKGFTEEILELNKKPNNKVIKFEVIDAQDVIIEKLESNPGESVYLVERLRCVDDECVIFERSYLPVKLFPNLTGDDLKGSKYTYVEEVRKERIKESIQEIVPEIIEEPIKTLLDMKENTPILKVKSQTILESGIIFEYTETYFKSNRYKFIQKASRF
ncbi:GntR family transcriptional regulator [Clostridium ganghwense]|uniref:GntR family transcriptional regulator n=1 Tax=Clostridium ganghwense TaxID=312089 RepID=A0ABT4CMD6_9CLOT|nr:GntR family transcriptional regulator [Clostridium ganghwense]